MGAGDGKRVETAPEMCEHFGAMADAQTAAAGLDELRIVLEDGGRHHDHRLAIGNVLRTLADKHLHAVFFKLLGVAAFLQIRSADAHPLVVGNMGDAAHADAADAYEVQRLGGSFVHDLFLLSGRD